MVCLSISFWASVDVQISFYFGALTLGFLSYQGELFLFFSHFLGRIFFLLHSALFWDCFQVAQLIPSY